MCFRQGFDHFDRGKPDYTLLENSVLTFESKSDSSDRTSESHSHIVHKEGFCLRHLASNYPIKIFRMITRQPHEPRGHEQSLKNLRQLH